jgi:hypothetical protein
MAPTMAARKMRKSLGSRIPSPRSIAHTKPAAARLATAPLANREIQRRLERVLILNGLNTAPHRSGASAEITFS